MGDTIRQVLEGKIPNDTAEQVDAFRMMDLNKDRFRDKSKLLDLGAGTGGSYERLKNLIPALQYVGLDIEVSPEVESRTRTDLEFHVYDGVAIPFPDNSFDIVFCKQVLEHVRHPDAVISEVSRVLRPDGIFVGSCSQLEPYHSHSIFNWTAYGIIQVFESHNLTVTQLRPGIDGITLTMRRLLGLDRFNSFFAIESLFNHYIDGQMQKSSATTRNIEKLIVAGHIVWLATKNA